MYIIKRIIKDPQRKNPIEDYYNCSGTYGNIFTGFPASKVFLDYLEAAERVSKLTQEFAEEINKIIEDRIRYGSHYSYSNFKDAPIRSVHFEILNLDHFPMSEEFAKANSFQVIPEIDRDVEILYRNGEKCGVVTNFLRSELMKSPELIDRKKSRWRYIEDSTFLKYKKATQ